LRASLRAPPNFQRNSASSTRFFQAAHSCSAGIATQASWRISQALPAARVLEPSMPTVGSGTQVDGGSAVSPR
jgi:hypothetical protein